MLEPVSVIVTCFNLESFIFEAISSIRKQDYSGQIQIVVVDDCSTDSSRDILKNIDGLDLVFRASNGGVMNAMISGLRAVKNDVVFFLDGDDLWHREKLSSCMLAFGQDVKLCTHDLWYMDSNSNLIPRSSLVSEFLSPLRAESRSAQISRGILRHQNYVWLGSAFGIRRSKSNVDEFLTFCEKRDYIDTCYQDWPLAVWVASCPTGEMAYVDRKLFGYRQHLNNYSGSTQTIEKLRRNLRKSIDTMRLIEDIMEVYGATSIERECASRVKKRSEVLLASTFDNRLNLLKTIFKNYSSISISQGGLKTLVRVALCFGLGAANSHRLIEASKRQKQTI